MSEEQYYIIKDLECAFVFASELLRKNFYLKLFNFFLGMGYCKTNVHI